MKEQINFHSQKMLSWDDKKLMFQGKIVCELIPCEKYEKHWHLKFYWRNEPTPEFFNIINARENARVYTLYHMNFEGSLEALPSPLVSLND